MKFLRFLLIVVLFAFTAEISAQTYFPPIGKNWEERDASVAGLNDDKLKEAVEFAMANEYSGSKDLRIAIAEGFSREPYHEIVGPTKKRGGPAGLILKDGYIVAKWGDIDRVDMTFSVTKSYLSTVAGLAIDDGLISDVTDRVEEYVWDGTFDGSHNSQITWEHLLNQSSDWYGYLFGQPDWGDRPPREGGIDDWRNRDLKTPGTSYKYNDVRVNVLAYSLLHVYREPLPQVLKERIMDPIGASSTWRWHGYSTSWIELDGSKMQSVSGGGHSGGGIFINARDHARFGLLFLNDGNWDGKQLISEDWVNAVQVSSPANPSYGYMWWLNRGNRSWDGVSDESIYFGAGFGGNYIVVDKTNNMVIVTRWLSPSKLGEMMKIVQDAIK